MDIFWGVVALLLVVGSTVAALALRREDPARPWFPAGSDGAWPSGAAWDRDTQRLDAELRASAARPRARVASVDPHEVAAELVLRRVVPNPAVRDGVRGVLPAPADAAPRSSGRAPSSSRRVRLPH